MLSEGTILKIIYDCYSIARRKFYSIYGLVVSLLLDVLIITLSRNFILSIDGIDKTFVAFITKNSFYAISYLATILLILSYWYIKRSVPKIRGGKIGVLFGPDHNDEIRKELNDLESRVRKEITKKDLQKIISVKKLPPNQKTEDPEHNIKLLSKANARLLICGNFEEFTVQGKKITGFTSLTISFLRLPVHPRNVPILLRDAISGRQLGWDSENTIDRNIVANNLSEIARYIVGLSLITDQRYEEAQGIFGPLYAEVNMKYNQRRISAEIKRFKDTIDRAYVMSLVCEINEKYCIELVNESLFQLKDTIINSWKVKIDKAVQIKADASALMMLAIFKFLSNDIIGSKEALHRARLESNSHGNLLCDLSEAFLLCFEGNLRDSKQLYKRVISSKSTPDLKAMNNIFSFLDQAISRYPEKPQIRFAYALLNDEFGDKNLASIEYAHFISETNGNNVFDRWSREAILRKQRIDTAKDIE